MSTAEASGAKALASHTEDAKEDLMASGQTGLSTENARVRVARQSELASQAMHSSLQMSYRS